LLLISKKVVARNCKNLLHGVTQRKHNVALRKELLRPANCDNGYKRGKAGRIERLRQSLGQTGA